MGMTAEGQEYFENRERERLAMIAQTEAALEGVLADLHEAGLFSTTTFGDIDFNQTDVRGASILLRWLPRLERMHAKQVIVSKLITADLPEGAFELLVHEYDSAKGRTYEEDQYASIVAQVLAKLANNTNVDAIYQRANEIRGGTARLFLIHAAVKLSDEAKQEQLLLHALTSDKPLIFVGLEIVRKRKQASEVVRAEIEKLRQHKDRAIRSDAERCWKALLKGPSAGKQTKSHLGRPATPDELKDPNLAETSTDVEGAQLAGFLREVAKLFESGFGRPEVAALAEVADEMELDEEKGYRYEVSTKGTASALIVHLFLDDTDSFGVTFLGAAPVIAQVDAVLRQWIERVEQ